MKVLVLGGGFSQLNMIKRLKAMGDYIILVDYLKNNPGKVFADEHHVISTFDTPAVTRLAIDSGAEAIITMGTDQPVLTAAYAAEKCGIYYYVDATTALSVTNKRVMKKKFTSNGIPTPEYRFISSGFTEDDIEGLEFPAVLKPIDSQGQRGIFKVFDINDIRQNINETLSYSREDYVLLEEYYPNDEITVNGWVENGKAYLISVVDRVTMETENRIGICISHNYPSLHWGENSREIYELTQQIVDSFGISNGPLYFQYLVGDRGILVNEIAMRIGGAYEDIAIPIFSGIDILGKVIEYVKNGFADVDDILEFDLEQNSKHMSVQLFFIRPGKVSFMTPVEEIKDMDCVREALYIIEEGGVMNNIKNATARAGYVIIEGEDSISMLANVSKVFNKMQVLDESGNNLIIKYDDYGGKYKFI